MNNLDSDCWIKILFDLNYKDVTRCRAISQSLKIAVDTHEKELYSKVFLKLKNDFNGYNDIRTKLAECKHLKLQLQGKTDELSKMNSEIYGFMVTKHQGIMVTVCKMSSSVCQSIETYKETKSKLEMDILSLENKIKEYNIKFLMSEEKKLYVKFLYENNKVIHNMISHKNYGLGPKEEQRIFKKMMDLFGSTKEYEALPVLDLKNCKIGQNFQELKFEDLTSPIMKGRTEDDRNFFVLRCKDTKINKIHFLVISQYTFYDYATWKMYGTVVHYFRSDTIIDKGRVMERAYNQLAEAIITRSIPGRFPIL